jgi:bacteriophage CI repressor helix-turn-helix domain
MENNFELSAKSLGERLKKIRTQHGISRDQLAELFGSSRTTIQNYENGERSPGAEYLANYYKFFGVNLHWLITGDGAAQFQSFLSEGAAINSPREEMILHLTRQLNPQALNHLLDFLMNIQGIKTN